MAASAAVVGIAMVEIAFDSLVAVVWLLRSSSTDTFVSFVASSLYFVVLGIGIPSSLHLAVPNAPVQNLRLLYRIPCLIVLRLCSCQIPSGMLLSR